MKIGEPVKVTWIDSMASPGWGWRGDEADMDCTTVGMLIRKTKDRVIIALNKSNYSYGDIMEIPMVAVKKIKRLKE